MKQVIREDEVIQINGREVCTEEAYSVLNELSMDEQEHLTSMNEAKAVEAIYAQYFNYGFTNTHGVKFTTKF